MQVALELLNLHNDSYMYDTTNKQYLTYCTYYIHFKEAEYIQYNYLHKIVNEAPHIRDAINRFTRQQKLLQKKKDSCRKKRDSPSLYLISSNTYGD